MKPLSIVLVAGVLTLSTSAANASHYTIYIQRQIGEKLIIEHNPVPGTVLAGRAYRAKTVRHRKVRRARTVALRRASRRARFVARNEMYWSSSIAGGCWDGGIVRRPDRTGKVVVLQREVCGSIAENLPAASFVVRDGLP
jgi:hypothetical protein